MKRLILLSVLLVPQVRAQETPPIDMAARRESVVNLGNHIALREQRLGEIISDIKALDERNEKRIDSLVDTLKSLKDSSDTGTRINALKVDAINGLKKGITIYVSKRREIFERLRSDKNAPVEALTGDMEKFDARIQKRVDQIMELAKSMPAREDVEKYEDDGGVYWDGWYQETTRISEEWKQNRRQGVATEKSLREIRQALEKAIGSLEARRNSTAEILKNRAVSDAERALQTEELGRIDAILLNRRNDLLELKPSPDPETTAEKDAFSATGDSRITDGASSDQTKVMKDMLEDSRKDIAADFWTVLRKYGEAATERDKISALKVNLEARKKWLAEHDK